MNRVCRECGVEKDQETAFDHGKRLLCNTCRAKRAREVYNEDAELRARRLARNARSAVKDVGKAERQRLANRALKRQVMDAYGGVCACCGEAELMFLAIDHLDNNGAEHRRLLRKLGTTTYLWLREQDYPKGYQVLCHNCNWAKSHGGCPHQLGKLKSA